MSNNAFSYTSFCKNFAKKNLQSEFFQLEKLYLMDQVISFFYLPQVVLKNQDSIEMGQKRMKIEIVWVYY